jgi:hypothetical protein
MIHDLNRNDPILKEIKHQIDSPSRPAPDTAPETLVPDDAIDLIEFHHIGFCLDDDNSPLNDEYFENREMYHHFVFHFSKCIEP